MKKMIDIHCHILPCLDDGPKSIDSSIEMCELACRSGISRIIATPHYFAGLKQTVSVDAVEHHIEMLNQRLKEINVDVIILPGMEVFISHDIVEFYESGKILTLNKSRYMLIELPVNDIPVYTNELFYELIIRNIVPVLAHPERNLKIIENPEIAESYVKEGVLLQIDARSLDGAFGKKVRRTAEYFLNNNLVHFIASDAHTSNCAFEIMAGFYKRLHSTNIKYADEIFIINPNHLI